MEENQRKRVRQISTFPLDDGDDDIRSVSSHRSFRSVRSGAGVNYGASNSRGDGIAIDELQRYLETGGEELDEEGGGGSSSSGGGASCWMCEYGLFVKNLLDKPEDGFVTKFREYIESGAAFKLPPDKFFIPIKRYYDTKILPHHPEFGPCSIEKFRRHWFVHMKEPSLIARATLDKVDTLIEDISNNILFDDENTGRRAVDKNNLDAFVKLGEFRNRVSKLDPAKLIGAQEGMTYSIDKAAKAVATLKATQVGGGKR